jgi:hypothetical protein
MRRCALLAALLLDGFALAQVPPPVEPERVPPAATPGPADSAMAVSPRPGDVIVADLAEDERARVQRREIEVRVLVNGTANALGNPAFLVAPGEVVELALETTEPTMAPAAAGRYSAGSIALALRSEIVWSGAAGDLFTPTERGTVLWQSHAPDGTPSRVTVEVAKLAHASGETPTILEGTRSVLLIPGVRFDRKGDGILHGTNVGVYPNEAAENVPGTVRDNRARYAPPELLYRLDEATARGDLAPGVRLGALNPPVFPGDTGVRYVAADARIIRYWSAFAKRLQAAGHDPKRLLVLRGFVSPTDRARLAREGVTLSEFSRHLYGDAVAVLYAEKAAWEYAADGAPAPRFADLNKDGKSDIADVEALAALAHDVMKSEQMFGGMGVCAKFEGPGPAKGSPYLHIDLRGTYTPFREE